MKTKKTHTKNGIAKALRQCGAFKLQVIVNKKRQETKLGCRKPVNFTTQPENTMECVL